MTRPYPRAASSCSEAKGSGRREAERKAFIALRYAQKTTVSHSRTERRPERKEREEREAVEGERAVGLKTAPRRTIWTHSDKVEEKESTWDPLLDQKLH